MNKCLLMTRLISLSVFFFVVSNSLSAQWKAVSNPLGVQELDLEATDNKIVLATYSGLYITSKENIEWKNVFEGNDDLEKGSVSRVFTAGNMIYVRLFNPFHEESYNLISKDEGITWNVLNIPFEVQFPEIELTDQAMIYAKNNILYYSIDGGDNWILTDLNLRPFVAKSYYESQDVIYVRSTDNEYWIPNDDFTQWTKLDFFIEEDSYPRMHQNGDNILLVGDSIHYSVDNGTSFNLSNTFVNGNFSFGESVWAHNGDWYLLYEKDVYRSQDSGASWEEVLHDNTPYENMVFLDDGRVFISSWYAVEETDLSFSSVVPRMEGVASNYISNFTILDNHIVYSKLGSEGIVYGSIADDNVMKIESVLPDYNIDELFVADDKFVILGDEQGAGTDHELYVMDDQGNLQLVYSTSEGSWLDSDYCFYQDGKLFYFNFGNHQIYSEDFGQTWKDRSELYDIYLSEIKTHKNQIFGIGSDGVLLYDESNDSWQTKNNGLDLGSDPSFGINGTRLYSMDDALLLSLERTGNDYFEFYISHDSGENWTRTAQNFPEVIVPFLNSPQSVGNMIQLGEYYLMALRNYGVVVSTDYGLNWIQFNEGLPANEIVRLDVIADKAIVCNERHGFFTLDVDDILIKNTTDCVYLDIDKDQVKDPSDQPLELIKIVMEDGDNISFTNSEGIYNLLHIDDGNIMPILESPHAEVFPESHNTANTSEKDFAIQIPDNLYDLCVTAHTDNVVRPGFESKYYLKYRNFGNAITNAKLSFEYEPSLTLLDSSIPISTSGNNSVEFELGNLDPLEEGLIWLQFELSSTTNLGTILENIASVQMDQNDFNSDNNTFIRLDEVVGSYDPNDIQVDCDTLYEPDVVGEKTLRYLIRFQNTGTFYAENVIVKNRISDFLQINTISNIVTSHPVEIRMESADELSFVFEEIFLIDSLTNEPESHGFIEYEIKIKDDLVIGDVIPNQAAIFFDFNAPIITNVATTEYVLPSSLELTQLNNELKIYPSLFSYNTMLRIDGLSGIGKIRVTDMNGLEVYTNDGFDFGRDVLVSDQWHKGTYIITTEHANQRSVGKVIKF